MNTENFNAISVPVPPEQERAREERLKKLITSSRIYKPISF